MEVEKFVILVYDVNIKRVGKILKTARKYLIWVQNAILKGGITAANFIKLKKELLKKLDIEKNSILCIPVKSLFKERGIWCKKRGRRINPIA